MLSGSLRAAKTGVGCPSSLGDRNQWTTDFRLPENQFLRESNHLTSTSIVDLLHVLSPIRQSRQIYLKGHRPLIIMAAYRMSSRLREILMSAQSTNNLAGQRTVPLDFG